MKWVLWLAVLVCVVQCSTISRDELEDFSNFLLKTSSLDIHVKKGAEPDESFDEDEVVSDHAWEESGKFEGDLILNDRQRRLIVETVEGLSRNGLTDTTKRWPDNEVTYFIQKEHFTSGQVQAIQDGIDDLSRASCVKFRPYRKGDRDAVVIQGSRRGCFSQVGYQGGFQVLNLSGRHPVGRGCFRHGTVVHEMLHTLGFYHMQSSPDRDDYIDVKWANIVQPARHNFRKYNSFSVSDFGVGYDYDSVLHYSRRAFSANGQDTLVPKKNGAAIGQRVGLSDKDTQKLNKMYCDADNDAVQEDVNTTPKPKNKKKKPKNQPFQGEGIGYHQGKTVVIKLPAVETYKLPNVPSTHVFDFSTTPQVVSTPEAGGYRYGKELTYPYKPVMNFETVKDYQSSYEVKPILSKNIHKNLNAIDEKEHKEAQKNSNDSNEMKPEYVPIDKYDKDLNDAFHKLTMIVKQHVGPQNDVYKVNKDYSKFYTPTAPKKTNSFLDPLDKKFKLWIANVPSTSTSQIQKTTKDKLTLYENSNDKFKNSQLEDRMDISYRTTLPTKKPYSSYEQTETPRYATLEYLKNRDDYRNLYSPKAPEDDQNPIKDYKTYQQDIKIDPYDKGFYTDYVKEDNKSSLTDVSQIENLNKKVKYSKDELNDNPIHKQTDLTNKQIGNIMDASYRTLSPTKKPYGAYEQTETPIYATLEYLKDRHDISSDYKPKIPDEENRKESYVDEDDPTNDDWYKKDAHKYYTDAPKYDNNDDYDEDDDDNSTERLKKTQNNKTGVYDRDYYTEYEKESNGRQGDKSQEYNDDQNREKSPKNKQSKHNEDDYDRSYYTGYDTEGSSHSKDDANDDDDVIGNSKDLPTDSQLKHKATKYNHDYFSDFKKENDTIDVPAENSKPSPKKGQAYKLYGLPVPLTKDWYKPSYSIPGISSEDASSRSHEDHR